MREDGWINRLFRKLRRLAMLKRLKMWTYLTVLTGVSMLSLGCDGWGWDLGLDSWPRILAAYLREDIFG